MMITSSMHDVTSDLSVPTEEKLLLIKVLHVCFPSFLPNLIPVNM